MESGVHAGVLAVYRKGDADAVECDFRFVAFLGDFSGGRALQPVRESLVVGPDRGIDAAHFIVIDTGHELRNEDLWCFSKT